VLVSAEIHLRFGELEDVFIFANFLDVKVDIVENAAGSE
jgi:hypothetical protein